MIYFRYRLLNLDSLIPGTVGAILVWYTRDIAGDRDVRVPVPIKSMKEEKNTACIRLACAKGKGTVLV
jgi:hypothetical protein